MNTDATAASRSERLDGYLAQDPSNEQLLADAFDAAIEAQRFDAAGRHVQTGLAASGGSAAWRFRHATWAVASGDLASARPLLEALHREAQHPAVAFNLGYVCFRQADYAACAQTLQPLLGSADGAKAEVMWLRSLHQLDDVDRAWAWVSEALAAGRPLDAEVAGVASLVAVDADRIDEAGALAEAALRRLPEQMEALVARGTAVLGQGNAAAATQLAQTAIRLRDSGRARSLLGFAQLLQQDLPAALGSFEKAVALEPAHIGTWHGLGWTRLLLKDLEGASAAFEQALALDRNFGESHGAYAVVLAMQGKTEEAKAHAERARRLDPSGMAAQYADLLLAGGGNDPAAVERLARTLLAALSRGRRAQPPAGDSST